MLKRLSCPGSPASLANSHELEPEQMMLRSGGQTECLSTPQAVSHAPWSRPSSAGTEYHTLRIQRHLQPMDTTPLSTPTTRKSARFHQLPRCFRMEHITAASRFQALVHLLCSLWTPMTKNRLGVQPIMDLVSEERTACAICTTWRGQVVAGMDVREAGGVRSGHCRIRVTVGSGESRHVRCNGVASHQPKTLASFPVPLPMLRNCPLIKAEKTSVF